MDDVDEVLIDILEDIIPGLDEAINPTFLAQRLREELDKRDYVVTHYTNLDGG